MFLPRQETKNFAGFAEQSRIREKLQFSYFSGRFLNYLVKFLNNLWNLIPHLPTRNIILQSAVPAAGSRPRSLSANRKSDESDSDTDDTKMGIRSSRCRARRPATAQETRGRSLARSPSSGKTQSRTMKEAGAGAAKRQQIKNEPIVIQSAKAKRFQRYTSPDFPGICFSYCNRRCVFILANFSKQPII